MIKQKQPYWVTLRTLLWPKTASMLDEMKVSTGINKVQLLDWFVRGAYEEFTKLREHERGSIFDGYESTREESSKED